MASPIVQVRFPSELKAIVKREAKDRATSVSEVVKSAVVADLRKRGKWPPKRERGQ